MAAAAPIALGMQVAASVAGGIQQNAAARAAARVDEENARRTVLLGEQEADATRHAERAQAGEMLALLGGSGLQLGTGTAADLIADNAYQRELEILNIRTKRASEADNLMREAADKKRAGRAALIGGIFGAGATALQAVGDMRAQRLTAASRGRVNAAVLGGGTQPVPRMPVKGAY